MTILTELQAEIQAVWQQDSKPVMLSNHFALRPWVLERGKCLKTLELCAEKVLPRFQD